MENQPATIAEQADQGVTNPRHAAIREAWLQEGRRALEDYKTTGLHLDNKEVLDWMDKIIAGENAPMPKCHT